MRWRGAGAGNGRWLWLCASVHTARVLLVPAATPPPRPTAPSVRVVNAWALGSLTAGAPVRVLAAQLVKTTHQTHAETMAMLADQIDSLSTTVHEVVLQLETLSDVV